MDYAIYKQEHATCNREIFRPIDCSTKYSHVKLVDRVDIEAFIGILYLRAAFRLNILDREVIWNHKKGS